MIIKQLSTKNMDKINYPTNLTKNQWQVIEIILENKARKQKSKISLNTSIFWMQFIIFHF